MNITQDELYRLLKRHFGKDDLTSEQIDVITSILSGNDVLAITDNVADDSICYMLPAIITGDLVIFVSRKPPTQNSNSIIPFVHLQHSIASEHLQRRLAEIMDGKYKFIHVAPELFQDRTFLFALEKLPISLIVIDDAQRLSQIRYDFSPAYRHIIQAISDMDLRPTILALANTHREDIQKYIIQQLQMDSDNAVVLGTSFPDVALEVKSIRNAEEKTKALCDIVKALDGQCIIFANHRTAVGSIKNSLAEVGVNAEEYHGGVSKDSRYIIERDFRSKKIKVIISTNSLIPDVADCEIKMMIHASMPDSLDRYHDQIVYLNSSGKLAKCVLLCSPNDRDYHQILIEKGTVSLVDMWNISNVLKNYTKAPAPKKESAPKEDSQQSETTHTEWLNNHYNGLTADAKNEINQIVRIYQNLSDQDKNPYSPDEYDQYLQSDHWKTFAKEIRGKSPRCKVCGEWAEHIHHLTYRNIQMEKAEDVVALCSKCHCYIHPDNPMTFDIFTENMESEHRQYRLFEEPKVDEEQRIFIELEQLALETNISRSRLLSALSEMQSAGMLDILPNCALSARIAVKASKGEMLSYVEDETGKIVISWLLESMSQNEESDINLLRLSDELACPLDSIEHIFLSLSHHKAISYKPHSKIMALVLRDLDFGLGENIFEDIKGERYKYLSLVADYVHTKSCRERFIKQHLIGKTREKCGKCDNCLSDLAKASSEPLKTNKPPVHESITRPLIIDSDSERLYATILICAEKIDGLLGRRDMINMLIGKDTKRIKKYGFDHVEEFGFLSKVPKNVVLGVIDELLELGCLQITSLFFPMIKLTDVGRHRLRKIGTLSMPHKNSKFGGSGDKMAELGT